MLIWAGGGMMGWWDGDVVSNSVVVYLRLLTSAQIRYDPEAYEPFLFHPELGEQMTPMDFCNTQVEVAGKEAGAFVSSRLVFPPLRLFYFGGMSLVQHEAWLTRVLMLWQTTYK